jgi:hypothetical protein
MCTKPKTVKVGPLRLGESPRRTPPQHVAAGVSLRKTANDVTLAANTVTARRL